MMDMSSLEQSLDIVASGLDPIASLSRHLLIEIFASFSKASDLLAASQVCHRWRALIIDKRLWCRYIHTWKRWQHPGVAFFVEFDAEEYNELGSVYDPVIDDPCEAPPTLRGNSKCVLKFAFRYTVISADELLEALSNRVPSSDSDEDQQHWDEDSDAVSIVPRVEKTQVSLDGDHVLAFVTHR
jgi:hypothetical protein